MDMKTTITAFIHAVEANCFIDAHEILEQSWKALKQENRLDEARIQKGLINATTAIGLHHERGKTDAAKRVWPTFEKYRPLIHTVETEHHELYRQAEELLERKRREYCLD
jgi:hypothetical protein